MKVHAVITSLAIAISLALAAGASAATTPISMTVDYYKISDPQVRGNDTYYFQATGPLCPTGSYGQANEWNVSYLGTLNAPVLDLFGGHVNSTAWDHMPIMRISAVNTYVCDDGSGTFTVDWQGVGRPFESNTGVRGTFRITSGTGAYTGISANGSFWFYIYEFGGPHFEFSGFRTH
jgi:hypothetical protein